MVNSKKEEINTCLPKVWPELENICSNLMPFRCFPGGSEVKASASNAGNPGLIPRFDPWVQKIPWRRKWQPTPVFLPGESHGLRSLVGCSPWGRKELDTTEQLHFLLSLSIKK